MRDQSLIQVLYNSKCPVCRNGIEFFDQRTTENDGRVFYFDIASSPEQFARRGITINDVRRKIHVIRSDGQVLIGWPAMSAIWRRAKGYRWLAYMGDIPGLNWGAKAAYHTVSLSLWRWNRIFGRW